MADHNIAMVKLPSPENHSGYVYSGFKPGTTVLEKGHVREPGRRPFGRDTIFDRDVGVVLRDGVTLYTDVFRPADSDTNKVPAILLWGPYGKTGNGRIFRDYASSTSANKPLGRLHYANMGPHNCGVPPEHTSGYEKFEGLDPANWSERGYACVNIDSRGIGNSGGDAVFWGQQEAEDVYDTISWLETQVWCNGAVVMAGNSWLAVAQINFASRFSHRALKAIAPWEGMTDTYRQSRARGGASQIPRFNKMIMGSFAGPNNAEDLPGMLERHPLYDDYWEAKRVQVNRIADLPVYLTASYSSMLHTYGSFESFLTMKTQLKWIRVHPYQEWFDLYRPEMNDELQRFYDRYAKGIQNGWEQTPKVRLSLLAGDGSIAKPVIEEPYEDYPPPGFEPVFLHLDSANLTLGDEKPTTESSTSYAAHDLEASTDFKYVFSKACQLTGYPNLIIHMSTPSHDDMDVAIQLRKISIDGKPLSHANYPCPPIPPEKQTNVSTCLGGSGLLRASHVVSLAPERGLGDQPFYRHDSTEPIPPNTIKRLEIPLWPMGMVFEAGEGILLKVSGHNMCLPETEALRLTEAEDGNPAGAVHFVYTGGKYDSMLRLPLKYM